MSRSALLDKLNHELKWGAYWSAVVEYQTETGIIGVYQENQTNRQFCWLMVKTPHNSEDLWYIDITPVKWPTFRGESREIALDQYVKQIARFAGIPTPTPLVAPAES